MSEEREVTTLVAPLREVGPGPAPAFSVEAAFVGVRVIRRRRVVLIGVVAVAVAALAVAVPGRLHSSRSHWPDPTTFSLAAAHPTASLWPITVGQANAMLAGPTVPNPGPGGQLIAGTVTWKPSRELTDWRLTLYLVDRRTDTEPVYWRATSDAVTMNHGVWDDKAAQRYPWLHMVGPHGDAGIYYSTSLTADPAMGSVTFVAEFPASDSDTAAPGHYALAPIDPGDLTLTVVYHDPYGSGGWADRVFG